MDHLGFFLELLLALNNERPPLPEHRLGWPLDEEGIVGITGRVGLGLEQGIEVPEGRFHKLIGRHLLEAHLH